MGSSKEPTLAYTVHHKGRQYRAGTGAEEIGEVAGEFGDHVWVDGKAPAKSSTRTNSGDSGGGGTQLGTPPVPTPSALPGGDGAGGADDSAATAPTTTGNRRGNNRPGS